ncbi:MAG TPA: hypothetical protein DEB31_08465 [Clostridiales bacterium]|nr:hypothetical protein [Clostridiales bacterium]
MSENQTPVKWANPTPAGLVALAMATFVFFALLSGAVDSSARLYAGFWLIGGFFVQIIVALLDLRSGNAAGGNTFLFFSSFFMLISGILLLVKWWVAKEGLDVDGRIDGYVWIVLTLSTILWTPAFFKSSKLLVAVLFILDAALPFVTLLDLKLIPASMSMVPAVLMLLSGCLTIYLAAAMVVNASLGRTVFPIPAPLIK